MIRQSVVLLALTGCASSVPLSNYNGYYFGALHASCYDIELTQANVWGDGNFTLTMGQSYRAVSGKISPDRSMLGTGHWVDEKGPVNATFVGTMARPFFGQSFSGTMIDGRCDPCLTLSLPKQR